jgi:UV DNA damage repair endonuclease
MFDPKLQRIGFACKIVNDHGVNLKGLNTTSTTITWLNNQTRDKAVDRLWELMKTNVQILQRQMLWIALLPPNQRMFRIGSEILTAYTHKDWAWFYQQPDVIQYLESNLIKVGELASKHDIRLSFHPGQFCVLASENPAVVENSIQEFEYHADLARYMGFGRTFQDFKCNVHIGGKLGPQGILKIIHRLTPEARNIITIENDEFKWGIEDSLVLSQHVALVLDIHHHWIRTGEYFDARDYDIVMESWRGVRPVIHYSCSREDVLVDHCTKTLPNHSELMSMGFTKTKLRAHSDCYWNVPLNQYAATFMPHADIMLESKMKNLASRKFLETL